jgi:Glu-tRNA(Gln) amidotransferase subunit E-like FAD-binding protein
VERKENLSITNDMILETLELLNDGKITKDAVPEIFVKKAKGEKIDLSSYKAVDDSSLESEIKKIVAEKPGLNMGAYMGLVMVKFKGKVDGKKASQIIGKFIKG